MTASTTNKTRITADPDVPTISIVREFDAPRERVYQAWIDPELVVQWMGPKNTPMEIDRWEARTGGGYRYRALRDGQVVAAFFGSFHELRENERLVQTFTWEEMPDGVSLDTVTFEDLGNGRSRAVLLSVVESFETRDAIIASGMETGVIEGFEKLDALLSD
jgi:uncharacterized protein YndB with AHSA1/START domain